MVREILSIGVGGCGVNMLYDTWDQFRLEHQMDEYGITTYPSTINDPTMFQFFEEIQANKIYKPRALFVDTETDTIDNINNSINTKLFEENCISFNSPTYQNFAAGYKSVGNQCIEKIMDKIRKIVEPYDNIQGFMFYRSVCGGSAGLSSKIMQELSSRFYKKQYNDFITYPTTYEIINNQMKLYNILLNHKHCNNYIQVALVFDNEKLKSITERYLKSYFLSLNYDCINEYISKMLSGFTINLRFEGELNSDMSETETNLVPFPELHYLVSSYCPIKPKLDFIKKWNDINNDKRKTIVDGYCRQLKVNIATDLNYSIYERYCEYYEKYMAMEKTKIFNKTYPISVQSISCYPLQNSNISIKIEDENDYEEAKLMAVCLNYRGDIKSKHVQAAIQWLKSNRLIEFVEWCPTGFKVGLSEINTAQRNHINCVMKKSHIE
eukprot:82564_1